MVGELDQPRSSELRYTPYLLIRSSVSDLGARPLPQGAVFWESPDVWVAGPDGTNQPVPGVPNTVYARVNNLGYEQANGVVVTFWWSDPSLAITAAQPIGTAFVNIPGRQSRVVQCPEPWVPVVVNGGHECLLAEAFLPAYDPVTSPLDPVLDRHVGQRNEQLVVVKAGEHFTITLVCANVAPLAQRVTIELYAHHSEQVPSVFASLPGGLPEHLLAPAAGLPLTVRLDHSADRFVASSDFFARRMLHLGEGSAAGVSGVQETPPWVSRSLELEAWEAGSAQISGTIAAGTPAGQTFLFRAVQRAGPVVTGGYTIALLLED